MTKQTHELKLGQELAYRVHEKIAHYTNKFILVGSLGRNENRICDVDLLIEPKDTTQALSSIREELKLMGDWRKGGDRNMLVENILNTTVMLDLYICHPPAQWGVLTAVRLNPVPLMLEGKRRIDEAGLTRKGGTIFDGKVELELPTEQDWFKLVKIPFVPPEKRWELTRDLRLI